MLKFGSHNGSSHMSNLRGPPRPQTRYAQAGQPALLQGRHGNCQTVLKSVFHFTRVKQSRRASLQAGWNPCVSLFC